MYKCKLCRREFESVTRLVSHLTHPKSKCKISIKEYYDRFLRKQDEGICQFCGRETAFASISKGYINNVCKHCRNKIPEAKLIRKKNYQKKRNERKIEKEEIKRKSGYYELPVYCEICKKNGIDKRFKHKHGLAKHISQKHTDIKIKDYYDKYFKKDDEGICLVTGKQTNFINLVEGYFKYYGKGTCSADKKIKQKKENTIKKNYGVLNPALVNKNQRIKKYKKTVNDRKNLIYWQRKFIDTLRLLTINHNNKSQCQICGKLFFSIGSVSLHVKRGHKISVENYYNFFFKKDNEGTCPISNLKTTFDCLERGYYKYHPSIITYIPEIKKGARESNIKYIRNKILEEQSSYEVEILNLNNINHISDKVKFKCKKCNHIFSTKFTLLRMGYGKCPNCRPSQTVSEEEKKLHLFIKELLPNIHVTTSDRRIIKNPKTGYPLELDIFIPSTKFAIEYNGIYWHSECVLKDPMNYHIIKTKECNIKGISLIHIFEDEWIHRKDIVKSILRNKFNISSKKIYARKCIIKEIDHKQKNIFLGENHLQGFDTSRIKLGAFYNDELVSVMTFSLGNISKGGDPTKYNVWELSRFASKINYNIPGIASKLLSFFERNYNWKEIFSFADLRWSVGNLYYKLGFDLVSQSLPNYWYVDSKTIKRIHRFSLRKRPDEPRDIPEYILRHQQGFYRIWDCGNLKFVKTR